jgi:signal transduction histidine kinase
MDRNVEQLTSFLEFSHMNTGLYVQEIREAPDASRGNDRLPAAVRQTRTEMEACVSVVRHKLKRPLDVILATSNAIFNVTDLTSEELYEYLRQIRANAYKMDEIINSLLNRLETP